MRIRKHTVLGYHFIALLLLPCSWRAIVVLIRFDAYIRV